MKKYLMLLIIFSGCLSFKPEKPDIPVLFVKAVSLDDDIHYAHYKIAKEGGSADSEIWFIDSVGKFAVGDTVMFTKK
jgi:hypothetical protein